MKMIARVVLLLGLLTGSYQAFAESDVSCQLVSSGIPAASLTGSTYVNTYNCQSNLPFPVDMSGSMTAVDGQSAEGVTLSGSCQNAKVSNGQICQFNVNFTPEETGQHGFNLNVSIGEGENNVFGPIESNVTKPAPPVTKQIIWSAGPDGSNGQAAVDATSKCFTNPGADNTTCYFWTGAYIQPSVGEKDFKDINYSYEVTDSNGHKIGSINPAQSCDLTSDETIACNFTFTGFTPDPTANETVVITAEDSGDQTVQSVSHSIAITSGVTPPVGNNPIFWPGRNEGVSYLNSSQCYQPVGSAHTSCYFVGGAYVLDGSGNPEYLPASDYSYALYDANNQLVSGLTVTPSASDKIDSSNAVVNFSFTTEKKSNTSPIVDNGENVVVTATYTDKNGTHTLHSFIPVNSARTDSNPLQTVLIYNNSDHPIYPVYETGVASLAVGAADDQRLQAALGIDVDSNTPMEHIYINPMNGIPAHGALRVQLPLYSNTADHGYVDWWNGFRIYVFDNNAEVLKHLAMDKNVGTETFQGDQQVLCAPNSLNDSTADETSATCEGTSLTGYLFDSKNHPADLAFDDGDANQLTEYTLAAPATDSVTGKLMLNPDVVDYDISYVDSTYLPVTLEPFSVDATNNAGYTGTTMSVDDFRQKLNNFNQTYSWPAYLETNNKYPGGYNLFMQADGLHLPVSSTAKTNMTNLWMDLLGYAGQDPNKVIINPNTDTCSANNDKALNSTLANNMCDVWQFFLAAAQNYENGYGGSHDGQPFVVQSCTQIGLTPKPLTMQFMINHIYGWSELNDCLTGSINNPLNYTQGYTTDEGYQIIVDEYKAAQNSSIDSVANPEGVFNPYVNLIHGQSYIDMNAYSYSIDDASGNMNLPGQGVVMTVGGADGLPMDKAFEVPLSGGLDIKGGAADDPSYDWSKICYTEHGSSTEICPLVVRGETNFGEKVTYPINVTMSTAGGDNYTFTANEFPLTQQDLLDLRSSCQTPHGGSTSSWCQNLDMTPDGKVITTQPAEKDGLTVILGSPIKSWVSYSIAAAANVPLNGAPGFYIPNTALPKAGNGKPVQVILQDNNSNTYQFSIPHQAPLADSDKSAIEASCSVDGDSKNTWCMQFNIDMANTNGMGMDIGPPINSHK